MKILSATLFLVGFLWLPSFAQSKMVHHTEAMIQSKPEDVTFLSNPMYAFLLGANEEKPGVWRRTISITNLRNQEIKQIDFKTLGKGKTELFGHHITRTSLVFFEHFYDKKEQQYTLAAHQLDLRAFEIKTIRVLQEKTDVFNRQVKFAKNSRGEQYALYSLIDNGDHTLATTHFLDGEYKIRQTQTSKFKRKLAKSFDWQLLMNNAGHLIMIHKLDEEQKGSVYVYHLIDNRSSDKRSDDLRILYDDNEKHQIHDVKFYFNDESVLEIMALASVRKEEQTHKQVIFQNFHPAKGVVMFDYSVDLFTTMDLKLHSFLPINEEFSIIVTQSEKPTRNIAQRNQSIRDEQNRSSRTERQPKEEILTVYYIHNQKGILWREHINLLSIEANPLLKSFDPQMFDYSFWSDSQSFYAFFNTFKSVEAQQEGDNKIQRRSDSNAPQSGLTPSILVFDLNSGNSKERRIPMMEEMSKYHALPSTLNINTPRYFVALAQVGANSFLPVQVFL